MFPKFENYLEGKKKKNTVLIMFPNGGYGTFLEWAVRHFSGQLKNDRLPFLPNGASPRYRGLNLDSHRGDHIGIADYLKSDEDVAFARTHAQDLNRKLDVAYTHTFTRFFRKIILLVPDESVELLIIHNLVRKLDYTPSSFFHQASFAYEGSYDNKWELREALSRWLIEHRKYIQLWKTLYVANDDVYYLNIRDLVNDPEKEIDALLSDLNLTKTVHKPEIFQEWLSLQSHLNIDYVCQNVVNSVVNGTYYDWSEFNLDIYDEAWIQWQLRDFHGIDMKYYNLVDFPTNTDDLEQYLIRDTGQLELFPE